MLHRTPDWAPSSQVNFETLERLALVFWGIALVGTGVLYAKARGLTDPARLSTFAILGWALAEMVALYGGVIFFLAGNPRWYLIGLAFLALSLTIFPAPRRF